MHTRSARQHTHASRYILQRRAHCTHTHKFTISYYKPRDTLAALDLYSTARATACLRPLALPFVLVHSNVRPDDQRLRSQDCPHPTHTHAPRTTYRSHHTHTHIVMRAAGCPPCARLTGECPLVPYPCCRVPSRRSLNHPCRRYTRHRTRGVEAVSVQHPGSLTHTARRRGFAHSRPASTTRDATECRRCYAA